MQILAIGSAYNMNLMTVIVHADWTRDEWCLNLLVRNPFCLRRPEGRNVNSLCRGWLSNQKRLAIKVATFLQEISCNLTMVSHLICARGTICLYVFISPNKVLCIHTRSPWISPVISISIYTSSLNYACII